MTPEQRADEAREAYYRAAERLARVCPDIPNDPIARARISLAASGAPVSRVVKLLHLGVARNNVEKAKKEIAAVELLLSAQEKAAGDAARVEQIALALDEGKTP